MKMTWVALTISSRPAVLACLVMTALLGAASGAALLQRSGLWTWTWEGRSALTNIQPGSGHSFISPLPSASASAHNKPSSAKLFEDGEPLDIWSNSQHEDIRRLGEGRHSFWHKVLYFSSSDNSDPRINGRVYEVELPREFRDIYVYPIYSLFIMALLIVRKSLLRIVRDIGGQLQPRTLFYISCAAVTIAFVLARIPWLVDFRIPLIQYDTSLYFSQFRDITFGRWPVFSIRTPGYPLFLASVLTTLPYLTFIVAIQAMLTLLSTLFLLYAVYKTCGKVVVGAGVALVAHASQPFLAILDFTLMSESLFTSFFLFFLGLFILGTRSYSPLQLLLCGIAGGIAIQVRPAGVFILVLIAFGVIHLIAKKREIKSILCLMLPAPLMLLSLMAYNYAVIDSFTISSLGRLCHFGISATFWEPDSSLPAEVNEMIIKVRDEIPENEKRIIKETWDMQKLGMIIPKWAGNVISINKNVKKILPKPEKDINGIYVFSKRARNYKNQLYSKVSSVAFIRHPVLALKVFLVGLAGFVADGASYRVNLYNDIGHSLTQMYMEDLAKDPFMGREYTTFPKNRALAISNAPTGERIEVDLEKVRGMDLHSHMMKFARIFDSKWITLTYFTILLLALVRVIQTKFRHWGSFILFSTSSTLIGAGMVVGLTTSMTNRYPVPTRFIEILAIGLLFLAWRRSEGDNDRY